MANKKKKYNAKFPPARVKKIMQKDEEVGKVAAAVPVIIARALEFFVMDLMSKANERIMSKNAKTLTPEHIKQTVNLVEEFSFLKELVAPISDVQSNNNHTQAPKQTSKQKHEAKQEMKQLRNESSSSASSFLLQTDETPVFKVPTRGRPKKLKVPPEEVSSKSKKMKVTNYVSLPEDCVEEKKEEDVQHAFQVVMNNFNPAVEPSTALQNIPLSQPPSLPLTSPPIPSFTSPLAASSISNRILFQPPLESSLNSKLTTSNKIADALQAINSNNSAPTNNTNNNNGAFINISNILNYNHSNTLLTEAYNNTSNFSNNQEYSLNNTNHNNTNTFTPATVIDSSDSQHIPHPPTNISQLGDNFSHLDEVLDLSKQATNQEAAEQLKKTLTDGNHLGLNPNNNLFISNTLLTNNNFNNNNPLVANNNCFNNNTASNNDINAIINSKADKRPSEMYKLNVPKLNSFYHRSTSSS